MLPWQLTTLMMATMFLRCARLYDTCLSVGAATRCYCSNFTYCIFAVSFKNIESSVKKAVKELNEMGINKIIALSHSGFNKDIEVALLRLERLIGLDLSK